MSALARWDAFLAQISTRHQQVRDETQASERGFIATVAGGGDPQPMSHRLAAVKHRLMELESKIADTWHAKVDDAICDEGNPTEVRDAAFAKGRALGHHLADARDEAEIALLAELARARYQAAVATAMPVVCPACGASGAPPHGFRQVELTCQCGRAVVYAPSDLMQSAGALGAHPISQEAAVVEWRAMNAAERAMHAVRPPAPLALIQAYEAAQIAYWYKYITARAWFEPELGRDVPMEVRKRLEQFYVFTADHEPAWREAGRPRAI
ncbi:MAG: hypothetical protein R3B06_28410 [Kofleriaceae bacterium]